MVIGIDALRKLAGSIGRGGALPGQRDLSRQLGVSSHTIHRWLRELDAEGLVEVVPRKGVFVRDTSEADRFIRLVCVRDSAWGVRASWGFEALMSATSRFHLRCQPEVVDTEDTVGFAKLIAKARGMRDCVGTVVVGEVPENFAPIIRASASPLVVLGDLHSERAFEDLPAVVGDLFQAGQLAVEHLLEAGCDRIVLVHHCNEPDWIWERETRAGALAAAELAPGCEVLLSRQWSESAGAFEEEVRQWYAAHPGRIGFSCLTYYTLPVILSARGRVPGADDAPVALIDTELTMLPPAGVQGVLCSQAKLAEVAIRRLTAIRRGVDAGGRIRVPFEFLSMPAVQSSGGPVDPHKHVAAAVL